MQRKRRIGTRRSPLARFRLPQELEWLQSFGKKEAKTPSPHPPTVIFIPIFFPPTICQLPEIVRFIFLYAPPSAAAYAKNSYRCRIQARERVLLLRVYVRGGKGEREKVERDKLVNTNRSYARKSELAPAISKPHAPSVASRECKLSELSTALF